jgi:hypothetical protein
MNKKLLSLITIFFSFISGYGQVANYSFSQASGTYTPFTGIPNDAWDDIVYANTTPIGFDFVFNDISYTTCSVNSNGYITFGTTTSSATDFTPISSNEGFSAAISALGIDLISNGSAIVYGMTGTAPNRVFIVQWTKAMRYAARNNPFENMNFQIKLYETSNVIQVVYGACATNYNTYLTAQVGLRGSTNADFNNRVVTNNWPASDAGTTNTASCRTGKDTGELPANGLTYTWTPKPIITSFTPTYACASSGIPVVITGKNFTATTAVKFNGVDATSYVVNSSTQITAILPATATTGTITVTAPGGIATSGTSFTVNVVIGGNTISGSQTICSGFTPSTLIGSTPTGGNGTYVYLWESSTTNASTGFSAAGGTNNGQNYTAGSLTSTTWYRRTVTSGGCSSVSSAIAVTVTAVPTAPIAALKKQPDCIIATGSVQLTGLPASGSWTITPNPATVGLTGLTGTGVDNTIVGGLTANTAYTFMVSNGSCPSGISDSVMINPVVTTTFNGTSWSSVPDLTKIGIFATSGNLLTGVDLCSCTINTGVNIKVPTGVAIKIQDKLNVNGSLTFEDGSSLIQINDLAVNTGNITYKRLTSTPIDNFDYTYWSSPVSPQKLIDVSPSTSLDKFYSFNLTVNDWQQEDPNTNMTSGVGYIIRGPQTYVAPAPPNFYQAPFKGVPNNGIVPITIPPTGLASEASALLGNPYPSALDADSFLIANMPTALEGTLYFWTHNTNIGEGLANLGSGAYAYTSDDYATYNLTGGAATGIGTAAAGINNSIPNGKIASGQAFFAGVKPAGGTVTFNNSMRLSSTGTILDNSQFFKLNNTKSKATNSIEKDRVWLNLFNSQGAFKQTLVGYITGATNEYDNGYDGETFDGNEFVDFYSVNQDRNLVIQGRALPFDETDEVPMGYKTTIAGDFTIAIAQTDGLLTTQDVFVEDKSTKAVKNLKEGPYNFSTVAGIFNDRFVLRYTNKTLGNDSFEKPENTVLVSNKNKQIKINSSVEMIDKIQIFDLLGRSIYQKMNVNTTEFVIANLVSNHQALLVKVTLGNGETVTEKIIY